MTPPILFATVGMAFLSPLLYWYIRYFPPRLFLPAILLTLGIYLTAVYHAKAVIKEQHSQ